jgi:hypothetical protein
VVTLNFTPAERARLEFAAKFTRRSPEDLVQYAVQHAIEVAHEEPAGTEGSRPDLDGAVDRLVLQSGPAASALLTELGAYLALAVETGYDGSEKLSASGSVEGFKPLSEMVNVRLHQATAGLKERLEQARAGDIPKGESATRFVMGDVVHAAQSMVACLEMHGISAGWMTRDDGNCCALAEQVSDALSKDMEEVWMGVMDEFEAQPQTSVERRAA